MAYRHAFRRQRIDFTPMTHISSDSLDPIELECDRMEAVITNLSGNVITQWRCQLMESFDEESMLPLVQRSKYADIDILIVAL